MIRKYPRTRHVVGSRKQPGDDDLECVPFQYLIGKHLVIEEKMDGANCAFSFGSNAEMRLQSRGHYLVGGPREQHFDLFKRWAHAHDAQFLDTISDRYIVYGEWLHAKHTVFYDALPHYFMEFDVLDLENETFLDTPRRAAFLNKLPIVQVKVLFSGKIQDEDLLKNLLGPSHFITRGACERLRDVAEKMRLDPQQVISQTDTTGTMEGLYIKVEENGIVTDRLKFVRRDFITRITDGGEHWMNRPLIPNSLREGVNLFSNS